MSILPAAPYCGPMGSIRSVRLNGDRKCLALTFDLCETEGSRTGYDAAIVDYLRRERVRATFFAGGRWMRSHPERAQQLMADPLFELGNHGWAHRNVRSLAGEALAAEVLRAQAEYGALHEELVSRPCAKAAGTDEIAKIPPAPAVFRFPYGACSPEALQLVRGTGLAAVQWDVATGDPSPKQTAPELARRVLRTIRPGSIVIAHANGRGHGTAEALPLFVPALRGRGFEFVTVSELLTLGEPISTPNCYNERPGDTDRYDRLGKGKTR